MSLERAEVPNRYVALLVWGPTGDGFVLPTGPIGTLPSGAPRVPQPDPGYIESADVTEPKDGAMSGLDGYLNDHLAGAAAAVRLAQRCRHREDESNVAPVVHA